MRSKKLYIPLLIVFFIIVLGIYFWSRNREESADYSADYTELYLIQTSSQNLKNTTNKFQYYNEQGKIVKEETFKDNGDISYNAVYGKYVYSYGPGGLYQTDTEKYKTKKLSDKDINIVHFFQDTMFYYENIGFKNNKYESKICNNNQCIDIDFAVVDFVVNKEYYYVLGLESFYIYKNDEKIQKIDVSNSKLFQRILTIDHRFFLFTEEQIYEIKDETIEIINENNIIQDINFVFYDKTNHEKFIFDRVNKKIITISLGKEGLKQIEEYKWKEYEQNKICRVSYSFMEQQPIFYSIDYNNRMLVMEDLNGKILKIKMNLKKSEPVFMIYKIK